MGMMPPDSARSGIEYEESSPNLKRHQFRTRLLYDKPPPLIAFNGKEHFLYVCTHEVILLSRCLLHLSPHRLHSLSLRVRSEEKESPRESFQLPVMPDRATRYRQAVDAEVLDNVSPSERRTWQDGPGTALGSS